MSEMIADLIHKSKKDFTDSKTVARQIIEAMHGPTREMLDRADYYDWGDRNRWTIIWQEMLNAALKTD